MDATPNRAAVAAMRALTEQANTHVAVVSGRSLRDLALLSRFPEEIRLVGSHGSEFDLGFAAQLGPDLQQLRQSLVAEVRELGEKYGTLVEEKPTGADVPLSQHGRRPDSSRSRRDRSRPGQPRWCPHQDRARCHGNGGDRDRQGVGARDDSPPGGGLGRRVLRRRRDRRRRVPHAERTRHRHQDRRGAIGRRLPNPRYGHRGPTPRTPGRVSQRVAPGRRPDRDRGPLAPVRPQNGGCGLADRTGHLRCAPLGSTPPPCSPSSSAVRVPGTSRWPMATTAILSVSAISRTRWCWRRSFPTSR